MPARPAALPSEEDSELGFQLLLFLLKPKSSLYFMTCYTQEMGNCILKTLSAVLGLRLERAEFRFRVIPELDP